MLLAHALGTTRVQLVIDAMRPLVSAELATFRELVKRRRTREPVAYILGRREFYGRTFLVDSRVLVPRPDTGTLVDVALARTQARSMCLRALDLCTGSGAVGITLARERPTSCVLATDASADALHVARDNALRLGAYNVGFRQGELFDALVPNRTLEPRRFDLVVSNPPYIAGAEIASLAPDVRDFEPRLALEGGEDGLGVVRRIVARAPEFLANGGTLALEVGAGQSASVASLLEERGFTNVTTSRDFARIERVVDGAWWS